MIRRSVSGEAHGSCRLLRGSGEAREFYLKESAVVFVHRRRSRRRRGVDERDRRAAAVNGGSRLRAGGGQLRTLDGNAAFSLRKNPDRVEEGLGQFPAITARRTWCTSGSTRA